MRFLCSLDFLYPMDFIIYYYILRSFKIEMAAILEFSGRDFISTNNKNDNNKNLV